MDHIIAVFDKVLKKARDMKVSDIHLCVGTPWKYRLNGDIIPIKALPPLEPEETEAIARHIILKSRNVLEVDLNVFMYGNIKIQSEYLPSERNFFHSSQGHSL